MRLDKWLWAARFFKTRALAAHACDIGRIDVNGTTAKPSRDVREGDAMRVRNEAGLFQIEVQQLNEARGPAAVAQEMYRESEESRALRAKEAAERKEMLVAGGVSESRPSKRDRSQLSRLRGRS